MATTSISNIGSTTCSFSINGLSNPFNTGFYLSAGVATSPVSGTSAPNGIVGSVSAPATNSSTSASGSASGLSAGTSITLYGFAQSKAGAYYAAGSQTILTKPATPSAPTLSSGRTTTGGNFSWGSVTGASSYTLTWAGGSQTFTSNSGTVNTMSPGTNYDIAVYASNATGNSGTSASVSFTTLPNAPGALSSSSTTTTITFSWSAPSGGYDGYSYESVAGGNYSGIETTTGATSKEISASQGVAYYFRIRTYKTGGDGVTKIYSSSYQSIGPVYASLPAPGTPGIVSATSGTESAIGATFTWSAGTNATSYDLDWSQTTTPTFSGITATSKIVNTMNPDSQYSLRVRSVNSSGTSAWSANTAFTTYATSTAPAITSITADYESVSIGYSGTLNKTTEIIRQSYIANAWQDVETKSVTAASGNIIFTQLNQLTAYRFRIVTKSSYTSSRDVSGVTQSISTTARTQAPGTPTVTTSTSTTLTIDWPDVAQATKYEFLYSTTSGSSYISYDATLTSSEVTFTPPLSTPGTKYYFVVRAYTSNGGWSVNSVESYGTLKPQTPTFAISNVTTGNIRVTVGSMAGDYSYIYVERQQYNFTTLAWEPDGSSGQLRHDSVTYPNYVDFLCTQNTKYRFSAFAVYTVNSPDSPFQEQWTFAKAGNPIAGSISGTSASISWTSLGSNVSAYDLEYSYNNGANSQIIFGISQPYLLQNLPKDTAITIKLRAVNPAGIGPFSNGLNFTTYPSDTYPTATIASNTRNSVTIEYTKDSSTPTNIYKKTFPSTSWEDLGTLPSGASGSYTINSLSYNSDYQFMVVTKSSITVDKDMGSSPIYFSSGPQLFSWTYAKDSQSSFNLKAAEWNNLTSNINLVRVYKNLSEYNFTTATTGSQFTAAMYKQARTAIGATGMNPSVAIPADANAGDQILAAHLNGLKNSINSVV